MTFLVITLIALNMLVALFFINDSKKAADETDFFRRESDCYRHIWLDCMEDKVKLEDQLVKYKRPRDEKGRFK